MNWREYVEERSRLLKRIRSSSARQQAAIWWPGIGRDMPPSEWEAELAAIAAYGKRSNHDTDDIVGEG